MKHILLKTEVAFVAGVRRTASEGVISCDDDEAGQLIAAGVAEDVSDDFADAEADSPETKPAKVGK